MARLQAILKEYKKEAKLNLILVGTTRDNEMGLCIPSVSEEASRIHLRPFSLSELKDLMAIHAPDCAEEDVLVLHALTGSVQYYVADMLDHGAVTKEAMIDRMLATSSIYKVEGRDLLSREFDRRAVNYIGILRAMALGATKFRDIVNISGFKICQHITIAWKGGVHRTNPCDRASGSSCTEHPMALQGSVPAILVSLHPAE